VINSSTKLAGTSGGSITSAALCSGMPPHQMFAANMAMAQRCRAKDACKGFLASAVRDSMAAALPANAAQSCAGRLWTTATQAKPHHQRDTGVLVGPNWSSNGQILDAVVASSFIPGMSGGLVTDALKAEGIPAAYDGGFTNMIPTPPGARCGAAVTSLCSWAGWA
jgi:predicted acylesterase/phospholipase RssA